MTSEGRFEELHESLLFSARANPDSVEGGALAVRAARVAIEGLGQDVARARAAIDLAIEIDPSCEEAWQFRLELDSSTANLAAAAESLLRLGHMAAEPRDRARYYLQAGDVYRSVRESAEEGRGFSLAKEAYLAAVRAIPPAQAAGLVARRLIVDGGRVDSLLEVLTPERDGGGSEAALDDAEVLLLRGRILAPDPHRREEAVRDLLSAAESADGPGRVALEILGGLHGLFESWPEMASGLERDASLVEGSDPRAAADLLRRVVSACLEEPVAVDRAEAALRKLVALDPEDVGSVERLVEILGAAGKHREAVDILVDLSELAESATASMLLMRAGVLELARFGERAASLQRFEAALARHPGSKAAATHLKEAYRDAERWQDLARVMVAEVEGKPIDDRVLDNLREAGRILRDKAGDVVAAAEVYKRIVVHDATDEDAVRFFQDFHDRIDREGRAVEQHSAEAASADSERERIAALMRAAEASVRLGTLPRARSFLDEARSMDPKDPVLRDRVVSLLLEHGDHGGAAEVLSAEIEGLDEVDSDRSALMWRLAGLLLGPMGEVSRARDLLRRIEGLDAAEAQKARELLEDLERDLSIAASVRPDPRVRHRVRVESSKDEGREEDALTEAREAAGRRDMEAALDLASRAANENPLPSKRGIEAREMVADILIDHFGDLDEGLDRLARIGRERSLPLDVRRRVNEARVRLLGRDVPDSPQRDIELADALLDAAAVAENAEQALGHKYRAGRALCAHHDSWRRGAEILSGILLDDPDFVPALELLAETYDREEKWSLLVAVLWKLAENTSDDERASMHYGRLADVAADRLDDPWEAVRAARRSLERRPGDEAMLEALAWRAALAGDAEAEAFALRGRIAIESDHSRLLELQQALAVVLEKADMEGEALRVYRLMADQNPRAMAAWVGMERTARAVGEIEVVVHAIENRAIVTENRLEAASLLARAGTIRIEELSDREGAEEAAEQALKLEPGSEEALDLLHRLARRKGARPEHLVGLLRSAAEAASDPERSADLWCEVASFYGGSMGHEEAALLAYSKALDVLAGHPPALAGMARLLLEAGDTDLARPYLRQLSDHEGAPSAARAWALSRLAELAATVGDEAAARQLLDIAIALDPSDARSLTLLGKLALLAGQFTDAVDSLTKAVGLGEREAAGAPVGAELTDVYASLGAAWQGLGRSREAARAWRKALSRDALHNRALFALASIAEEEGDWETVAHMRERLAELIADSKDRAATLAVVGAILRDEVSDPRRAAEIYRRAASLNPEDLGVQASLLALARRLGRMAEAREAALACARLAPEGGIAADYLAVAGECAEAEGDVEEALDLARAALELDPACEAALNRAIDTLEARGERLEAAEILQRAADGARDTASRRVYTVARARLLQDAGEDEAASSCLVRAFLEDPFDVALMVALAGSGAPSREDAQAALSVLVPGLLQHPLDRPRLMAAASMAAHLGDYDRAFVCGSLLSLMRADDGAGEGRTAELRDLLPEATSGVVPETLIAEILPESLVQGESFYRAAEATVLTTPVDRRPFDWTAPESRSPSPFWVEEMQEVARALRLPSALELRIGPEGSGVRLLPDRGRLIIAEDLLLGRLPGERRFTLAFGLALSVPGRRWVAATGSPEVGLEMLLAWARGEADHDTSLTLGETLGPGRHPLLASHAGPGVPGPARFMDLAVMAASRLGLLASFDPVQALSAGLRLLAPGRSLPREAGALAALARIHPALGDMQSFLHSPLYLDARRELGIAARGR